MNAPLESTSPPPVQAAGAKKIGDVILDVNNISLSFGGVKALADISFNVKEHEIRAIIGPNGAGKSSMLNCINGVYTPQQGSITFRGQTFKHMNSHQVAVMGVARTFQNLALFKGMSVLDNIMTGRNLPYAGYTDLAQKPEVYQLIRECVEKVNADLSADALLAGSQISRFLVLHKELDADDGELTRTNKVRRGFIAEKYGVLVEALYGGKAEQYIQTQVKFEDGRTGSVSATLKLSDAKTFTPVKAAA